MGKWPLSVSICAKKAPLNIKFKATFPLHRNGSSIDLHAKPIDWYLYERNMILNESKYVRFR